MTGATLRIVPFDPAHLDRIEPPGGHDVRFLLAQPDYRAALARSEFAGTLSAGGTPLACAGLVVADTADPAGGRLGEAWAHVDRRLPAGAWTMLTRAARRGIAEAHANGVRRIEINARLDFPPAHRWALLLGFRLEGVRPGADGPGYALYGRTDPPAWLGNRTFALLAHLERVVLEHDVPALARWGPALFAPPSNPLRAPGSQPPRRMEVR